METSRSSCNEINHKFEKDRGTYVSFEEVLVNHECFAMHMIVEVIISTANICVSCLCFLRYNHFVLKLCQKW